MRKADPSSPWVASCLSPQWSFGYDSLTGHYGGKKRERSFHASQAFIGCMSSLYPGVETGISIMSSCDSKRAIAPRSELYFKKQLASDIAQDSLPLAVSLSGDLAISSQKRVRSAVFQEYGPVEGQLSLLVGRHLIIWDPEQYLQLYGAVSFGKASSAISWRTASAGIAASLSRYHEMRAAYGVSTGHGRFHGHIHDKKVVLSPQNRMCSVTYMYRSSSGIEISFSWRRIQYTKELGRTSQIRNTNSFSIMCGIPLYI